MSGEGVSTQAADDDQIVVGRAALPDDQPVVGPVAHRDAPQPVTEGPVTRGLPSLLSSRSG